MEFKKKKPTQREKLIVKTEFLKIYKSQSQLMSVRKTTSLTGLKPVGEV